MSKTHMTIAERIVIEGMLNNGRNFAEIGRAINKNRSTISREVQNHSIEKKTSTFNGNFNDCKRRKDCPVKYVCDNDRCNRKNCSSCKRYCGHSCPGYTQEVCKKLLKVPYVCNSCKEKAICTLTKAYYESCEANKQYEKELKENRQGFSITQREAKELQHLIKPLVSQGQSLQVINMNNHEQIGKSTKTLYTYVNSGVFPEIKNIDLPRKVIYRKRYKKVNHLYKKDLSFKEGRKKEDFDKYMRENPNTQIVEMDTVEGPRIEKRCLLTLLFVNCNLQLAFLREANTCESTIKVWNELKQRLSREDIKTLFPVILTDNGSEFSNPEALEINEYGEILSSVYYCHPLASWEKSECENNHALIRRILPKGYSFLDLTQEKVDLMMNHINSYPRPQYNGKTPYEMFVFFYGIDLAEKLGLKSIPRDEVTLKPSLLHK